MFRASPPQVSRDGANIEEMQMTSTISPPSRPRQRMRSERIAFNFQRHEYCLKLNHCFPTGWRCLVQIERNTPKPSDIQRIHARKHTNDAEAFDLRVAPASPNKENMATKAAPLTHQQTCKQMCLDAEYPHKRKL